MANERDNEALVRDALRELGYTKSNGITVEEQSAADSALSLLLSVASKTGKGGKGSPEFIITDPDDPELVVVIECKAETKDHASKKLDKPVKYAVDGALHYAKFLSEARTVVAIGSSGESADNWRVSTYVHRRGAVAPEELRNPNGTAITTILPLDTLREAVEFDPEAKQLTTDELLTLSKEIHNFIRVKISESHKALLIAGTLIALRDREYRRAIESPNNFPAGTSAAKWLSGVHRALAEEYDLPKESNGERILTGKPKAIYAQLSAVIETNPSLYDNSAVPKKYRYIKAGKATPLDTIARSLADYVYKEMRKNTAFDILGAFYGEFLAYSGGDSKLGIVLTPQHVTELMCELAGVNGNTSIVVDPCTGTGGFLIAAMNKMFATPGADGEYTKRNRLIGIEKRSDMYALGAANMILRGDGKSSMYHDDCFSPALAKEITSRKDTAGKPTRPNVGIINPPYGVDGLSELKFITNMLDLLDTDGIGVAIVPMSAATATSKDKADLMAKHTLLSVMTMPKVFKGVGVLPIIMVFKAGVPHDETKPSWFALWTDDGHEVIPKQGRKDTGRWEGIREQWLRAFRAGVNAADVPGVSVSRAVSPSDEWVAEAYLETDYAALTREAFEKVVLDYATYLNGASDVA